MLQPQEARLEGQHELRAVRANETQQIAAAAMEVLGDDGSGGQHIEQWPQQYPHQPPLECSQVGIGAMAE